MLDAHFALQDQKLLGDLSKLEVFVNGSFCRAEDAKISVWDHGLLYGDGIFDDDPLFGKTNGEGQVTWSISYSEALNAGDGNNPESYDDFTSTVVLQLLYMSINCLIHGVLEKKENIKKITMNILR